MAEDLIVKLEAFTPDVIARLLAPEIAAESRPRAELTLTALTQRVDVDTVEAV